MVPAALSSQIPCLQRPAGSQYLPPSTFEFGNGQQDHLRLQSHLGRIPPTPHSSTSLWTRNLHALRIFCILHLVPGTSLFLHLGTSPYPWNCVQLVACFTLPVKYSTWEHSCHTKFHTRQKKCVTGAEYCKQASIWSPVVYSSYLLGHFRDFEHIIVTGRSSRSFFHWSSSTLGLVL